jgi:hypothetical protein
MGEPYDDIDLVLTTAHENGQCDVLDHTRGPEPNRVQDDSHEEHLSIADLIRLSACFDELHKHRIGELELFYTF